MSEEMAPGSPQCQTRRCCGEPCLLCWGPEPREGRKGLGEAEPAQPAAAAGTQHAELPSSPVPSQQQHWGKTSPWAGWSPATSLHLLPLPHSGFQVHQQALTDRGRAPPLHTKDEARTGEHRSGGIQREDPEGGSPPIIVGPCGGVGGRSGWAWERSRREGSSAPSHPLSSPSLPLQQQQVQNTKINALPTPRFPHRCRQPRLAPRSPPLPIPGPRPLHPRARTSDPERGQAAGRGQHLCTGGTRGPGSESRQTALQRFKPPRSASGAPAFGGARGRQTPSVGVLSPPGSGGWEPPRFGVPGAGEGSKRPVWAP